jgi:serine/threonine protein kinase
MNIPGYTIKGQIGKGGMATAYLAIQESLGREVVLKVLDSQQVDTQESIERFLAEGRIVASLNHPNIITIHDIGIADDEFYISMEYVKGGDLRQRIQAGMTPEQVLDYLAQITGGLRAAHNRGIVHRDIKPANILFREDGTPLITDFGIAKQIDMDRNLTATGIFLGSPNYISPEQADGAAVDGRSDIYSLGCILYEMLTGNKPFDFNSVIDVIIKHKQAPIPVLPEEQQEFQPLLNRMMAKKPEDRFQNADELLDAVETLAKDRRLRLTPTIKSPVYASRRGFALQILVVLLILSAGFFGTVLYVDMRLQQSVDYAAMATTDSIFSEDYDQSRLAAEPAVAPLSDTMNRNEVIRALLWLGRQSLEEYKLTYPPRDNAYYYFNKLLEIDPANVEARNGINEIANRYAILAERTLAQSEYEKTQTYVSLGLKIDPRNETLLSIKSLISDDDRKGILDRLRNLLKPS